ncbi:MAG: hypothetical protein U0531_21640, partial [Dehalococcoidia bacterium]
MSVRLADALDTCLDDLRHGRRTEAECLAAYPDLADRLRPLLRLGAGLDAGATPEPSAATLARLRTRVYAGLVPPQRHRWWQAVLPGPAQRLAITAAVAWVLLLGALTGV